MKLTFCSLSSPPRPPPHAVTTGPVLSRDTGWRITVAFPLDSCTSRMVLGFFLFLLFCFIFASFPECGKSTVQKGFNLPVDLKYFPPAQGRMQSCQAALYSVLCTIKKFAFSLPSAWNLPLSCPPWSHWKASRSHLAFSLSHSLWCPSPLTLINLNYYLTLPVDWSWD